MSTPIDLSERLSSDEVCDPAATRSPGSVSAIVVTLGLVAAVYWPLWPELTHAWDTDPNYSHGYLVLPLSLVFAWMIWRRGNPPVRRQVDGRAVAAGLAEIAFGLLLHVTVWFARNLFLDVLSLICVLRGLLLVLGGRETNRRFAFPALFLIFMGPLPISWYQPFANLMQRIVSGLAAEALELCGVPVFREGYLIHLPGYTMEVAEACCGLRQLTAILALAVVIGHLSARGRRFCWTLALVSMPIAIATNCLRAVLSGIIAILIGKEWAEGVFHTIEGTVIVVISGGLLLVAAAWLGKIDDRFTRRTDKTLQQAPV